MTAQLLDGKYVSSLIIDDLQKEIIAFNEKKGRHPGLAVILVGDDPASSVYVKNKRQACASLNIHSFSFDLPKTTTEKNLLHLISELNQRSDVDGILVQLPLPLPIDNAAILEEIFPRKDVDGFHPYNVGRLAQRRPLLRPCTPKGIITLLDFYQLDMKGKHAVIIGASDIVGRPMALEFLLQGATVTVCHRFTRNLETHVKHADILVIATGIADLVNPLWFERHPIVIDVGIHRQTNGQLRGDLNFEAAKKYASWITPVPGGVGPMTIASLMQNTLLAATLSD